VQPVWTLQQPQKHHQQQQQKEGPAAQQQQVATVVLEQLGRLCLPLVLLAGVLPRLTWVL
jgi:hypothetical protein